MWEQKDFILAAVVSLLTLAITKGWPIIQWIIEFTRKGRTEDEQAEDKREERNAKLRSEGYEQVISRLDKHVTALETKVGLLEQERLECAKQNAAMRVEIVALKEQVAALQRWKKSRSGSDSIPVDPDTGELLRDQS